MDDNELLFNDDELFDDEYADSQENNLNSEYVEQEDFFNEPYEQPDDDYLFDDELQPQEEDAIDLFLKSKGIDSKSIKFENENGDLEEVNFNDLPLNEKLLVLNFGNEQQNNDLTDEEIDLLNQIRRNNWSIEDYNKYIADSAIQLYQQNNNYNYSIADISDDELFALDLKTQIQNITDEELAEEIESAKRNPSIYAKRIENLRKLYQLREQQYRLEQQREAQLKEQQQMRQFTDQVLNTIQNNRYMDVGLGQETIELTDEDMQDIANFILGKDDAGNRFFANALNDPETLVKMAQYVVKGPEIFLNLGDYYKLQMTKVRKSAYNKGYDDAVSGRNNSGKAVVSKRLPSRDLKREQTIYDLD